jgi:hypothetical protein
MMTWDGDPVDTIGDLFTYALKAVDQGRAEEFLAEYRALCDHADANLGYVIGYGDEDSRRRMYEAFNLTHPVLGGRP